MAGLPNEQFLRSTVVPACPMILLLFITCAALLFYIYVGYPVLMWLLAGMAGNVVRRTSVLPAEPQCSVVISSYREGGALLRKVKGILDSASAAQIREIVIGFDGVPGEAEPRPGEFEELSRRSAPRPDAAGVPAIRVVVFPERRGKASVLNDLVPLASGKILVMMDARQPVHPDAILRLVANFSDERVGVVSGELVFQADGKAQGRGAASRGVGFYWLYEKFIRRCEARFRSVPGATGALYAIRRELFRPTPATTILDDVAIPMQAVTQGYRCVFEAAAEVYDVPSETAGKESLRKRRTIAGVAQLAVLYPEWLLPWRNPIWFEYASHKLLRLASPLLLAGLLAANIALLGRPWFPGFAVLQAAFYGAAVMGGVAQKAGRKAGFLGVPFMFVALNATTALALWDAFRGRYSAAWKK